MTKQQPSRPLLHLVGLKEDLKEREENGEYKFPPSVKPGATNCEVIMPDMCLVLLRRQRFPCVYSDPTLLILC